MTFFVVLLLINMLVLSFRIRQLERGADAQLQWAITIQDWMKKMHDFAVAQAIVEEEEKKK